MNGAVHGEATTTASTPDANASTVRFCRRDSPRRPTARTAPNSNTPSRLSAEHEEQRGQRGDHRRRLQLEAPAELLAGRAQRGQRRGRARRTSARRRRRTRPPPGAAWPGCRDASAKPSTLSRQHREHAGHQVEDDPADEREQQRRRRATARPPPARRGRRRQIDRGRRAAAAPGFAPGGERAGRARCRSSTAACPPAKPPAAGEHPGDPLPRAAGAALHRRPAARAVQRRRLARAAACGARRLDQRPRRTGRSRQRAGIAPRLPGGTSVEHDRRAPPCAVACQPGERARQRGARRGDRRAPARVGARPRLRDTGSASVRSAPSGMHTSLQTSQSARALSDRAVPAGGQAALRRRARRAAGPRLRSRS